MYSDPLDRVPSRPLFGGSPGDKLLASAQSVKLELVRYLDDDDRPRVGCQYRLIGELDVAADVATGELFLGVVRSLGAQRREGGAA